jgi:hypothetical protein
MQVGHITHVINRKLEKAYRKNADIALKYKETLRRNRYGSRMKQKECYRMRYEDTLCVGSKIELTEDGVL